MDAVPGSVMMSIEPIEAGTTGWLRAAAGASTLAAPTHEDPLPVPV